jgi:GAF domain-containing protein
MLSYEGWWDDGAIPALARSTTRLAGKSSTLEPEIIAVVREPVSFLVSLYKLDVLHGRTQALLADYWAGKLTDPRLRYGAIARSLAARFGRVRMLDFDDLSRQGQLVGAFLAEAGFAGILTRAGVPALDRHRSKGGEHFADSRVAMALEACCHLGQRTFQANRLAVMDAIAQVAGRPELAQSVAALAIGLPSEAVAAISDATRSERAALAEVSGLQIADAPDGPAGSGRQTVIAEASPLGRALSDALKVCTRPK